MPYALRSLKGTFRGAVRSYAVCCQLAALSLAELGEIALSNESPRQLLHMWKQHVWCWNNWITVWQNVLQSEDWDFFIKGALTGFIEWSTLPVVDTNVLQKVITNSVRWRNLGHFTGNGEVFKLLVESKEFLLSVLLSKENIVQDHGYTFSVNLRQDQRWSHFESLVY